jgi:hypothetical protein
LANAQVLVKAAITDWGCSSIVATIVGTKSPGTGLLPDIPRFAPTTCFRLPRVFLCSDTPEDGNKVEGWCLLLSSAVESKENDLERRFFAICLKINLY